MAEYLSPGVYVEEFDSGVKAMEGVGTSTAGFIGLAEKGPVTGRPVLLTSFAEYQRRFGGYLSELEYGKYRYLPNAVEQFFTNGGSTCYVMRAAPEDAACAKSAEGPVMVQAKNPGAWANTMQVFFFRSTRARTQMSAISGRRKTAASFTGMPGGKRLCRRICGICQRQSALPLLHSPHRSKSLIGNSRPRRRGQRRRRRAVSG